MTKTLLITGATGKQGGAVVTALLERYPNDFSILAVTRNADSDAARRLAARSPSIKLVQGNLNDVPALFSAAKRVAAAENSNNNNESPIWGVYSVQTFGGDTTLEGEVAQGKALVDESLAAGVRHFVYSSVERGGDARSWDNPTPVPHFQSKHAIEQHLRSAAGDPAKNKHKMGWTILRPVAFMDNLSPGIFTAVFLAALRNHLGDRDKALPWVATADIGVFGAMAFADPARWDGRAVGLAGDKLTMEQLRGSFSRATGSEGPKTFGFLGSLLTLLVREMGVMLSFFANEGYDVDIEARRREHPGLLTMEEWLRTKSKFASSK